MKFNNNIIPSVDLTKYVIELINVAPTNLSQHFVSLCNIEVPVRYQERMFCCLLRPESLTILWLRVAANTYLENTK